MMNNDLHNIFLYTFKFKDNGVPNTSEYLNLLDVDGAQKRERRQGACATERCGKN